MITIELIKEQEQKEKDRENYDYPTSDELDFIFHKMICEKYIWKFTSE